MMSEEERQRYERGDPESIEDFLPLVLLSGGVLSLIVVIVTIVF